MSRFDFLRHPKRAVTQRALELLEEETLRWFVHSSYQQSTFREGRRYLENHRSLLNPLSENILEHKLVMAEQQRKLGHSPKEVETALRELRDHLFLLRDARKRGTNVAAVREAYVNAHGGLTLDIPPWLEKLEQQWKVLYREGLSEQITSRLVSILREALVRAEDNSQVAPETRAEMQNMLGGALEELSVDQEQACEEAIAAFEKALQMYTLDRYPHLYAMTQRNLGGAYQRRTRGEKTLNLKQAIAHYQAALQAYTREALPEDWASVHAALAALYLEVTTNESGESEELGIAHCEAALQVYTHEAFPLEWAAVQVTLSKLYQERGTGKRRENQEHAIVCCQSALQVFTVDAFPEDWAALQFTLGDLYGQRMNGERRDNLERAIAHYQAALQIYTRIKSPEIWAEIQNDLGRIYAERIDGERRDNLEQAIAFFESALEVHTRDTYPEEWAATQMNLGNAYQLRIAGVRRDNLERAIACYNNASQVCTRDAYPQEWAKAQNLLGSAYWNRIEGNREANVEKAIAYHEAALQVRASHPTSDDYALTQTNLGLAYLMRITGSQPDNIERAIAYLESALDIYDIDRSPTEYAHAQFNLSTLYQSRVFGNKRENIEKALVCCHAALEVYTYDAFPKEWAMTQAIQGNAYLKRTSGIPRDNIEQAIACYSAALEVYTPDAYPLEGATVLRNLAIAAGNRMVGPQRINRETSIACYEAALKIYTRDGFPEEWAGIQNGLGAAYYEPIDGKSPDPEKAVAHFEAALQIFTLDSFPIDHRSTQLNLALAEAERQNWANVHKASVQAFAAEDILVGLSTGIAGRDAVLKEGKDAATNDCFALTRLGQADTAAVAMEHGRARGLAEALALDVADPQKVSDAQRRQRYESARQQFTSAQTSLNTPLPPDIPEKEQRRIHLERSEVYQKARQALNEAIAEIRAAHDPANFLEDTLDAKAILQAAQCGGPGHALVYLVATPWGGVAVAALNANTEVNTPARFATFDLPELTATLVHQLIHLKLDEATNRVIGGFSWAQEGNGFLLMLRSWMSETFRAQTTLLHKACGSMGKKSTLDEAAQVVLSRFPSLADRPLNDLSKEEFNTLMYPLNRIFLELELQHSLDVLSKVAFRPLIGWLFEQGVTGLTLIPTGQLAAFPLAAVPLSDGRTVGEIFPTSVAPSARSLLSPRGQDVAVRAGVYALGNPDGSLFWGEAEALTLTKLAREVGAPGKVKIQGDAKRAWLIEALQYAEIVDASCHGQFNVLTPLASALLLANGQRLRLGDLLSHQVDMRGLRLLILSACQTAILDIRGASNEVRSLAAGMIQAGAAAVLAALWSVDDKATYLLIVRFAQEWFPHMHDEPPAAALARAQRWLRTVTNSELKDWDASRILEPTAERQLEAGSETPNNSWFGVTQASADATELEADQTSAKQAQVDLWTLYKQGGLDREEAELVQMHNSRYDIEQAQLLLQKESRQHENPDAHPYAHPFYWAAFQITGW